MTVLNSIRMWSACLGACALLSSCLPKAQKPQVSQVDSAQSAAASGPLFVFDIDDVLATSEGRGVANSKNTMTAGGETFKLTPNVREFVESLLDIKGAKIAFFLARVTTHEM